MNSAKTEKMNTYRVKLRLNCSKDLHADTPVYATQQVVSDMEETLWKIETSLGITIIKGNYLFDFSRLESEISIPLYKITFSLSTEVLVDAISEERARILSDEKVKNMLLHFDNVLPYNVVNREHFVQFITKLN